MEEEKMKFEEHEEYMIFPGKDNFFWLENRLDHDESVLIRHDQESTKYV